MSDSTARLSTFARYKHILRNRSLMMLWGGSIVSLLGDIFFNLAIIWAIYSHSQSMLQASLVQVVWHTSRIFIGFIAGAIADRYNQKTILLVTNIISAVLVALLAVMMWNKEMPLLFTLAILFLLNTMFTFMSPAHYSIMPVVVGKEHLADATGLFTTISKVVYIAGTSAAGIFIAYFGAQWAVTVNAFSFIIAALIILPLRLPPKTEEAIASTTKTTFWKGLKDGWRVVFDIPELKTIIWIGILINVGAYMGPILPGLIDQQLHGGVGTLGLIQTAAIVGTMIGGIFAASIERTFGAGRLMIAGLTLVGCSIIVIALSKSTSLTLVFFAIRMLGMTLVNISTGTAMQLLIPEQFRGRAWGVSSSLGIIAIPISSVIGGYAADLYGASALFLFGGFWFICCALFVCTRREIRALRLGEITERPLAAKGAASQVSASSGG
ncbi:MFS transporter [Paenibacillus sp. GSMTC-2017]|uniref:MFS transporter n=1 Tax=Paenibacillus sp. GSMTC-2017 TaxID=2794350 RepID=UPI001A2F9A62|nr:MFS transporter [Paenibacillus sp. GSMTC-2017]MBH5318641.1 MFS transporter [Paenibacillus sp. GSMTC-2017]